MEMIIIFTQILFIENLIQGNVIFVSKSIYNQDNVLQFVHDDKIWCGVPQNLMQDYMNTIWSPLVTYPEIIIKDSLLWIYRPLKSRSKVQYTCVVKTKAASYSGSIIFSILEMTGPPRQLDSASDGILGCIPGSNIADNQNYKIFLKFISGPSGNIPSIHETGEVFNELNIRNKVKGLYKIHCLALTPPPVSSGRRAIISLNHTGCLNFLNYIPITVIGQSNKYGFAVNDRVICKSACPHETFVIKMIPVDFSVTDINWEAKHDHMRTNSKGFIELNSLYSKGIYAVKCITMHSSVSNYRTKEIFFNVVVPAHNISVTKHSGVWICRADGFPVPKIQWMTSFSEIKMLVLTDSMLIIPIDNEIDVNFTCRAFNIGGEVNITVLKKKLVLDSAKIAVMNAVQDDLRSLGGWRLFVVIITTLVMFIVLHIHYKYFSEHAQHNEATHEAE